MARTPVSYPQFRRVAATPALEGPGVAIAFDPDVPDNAFDVDSPIVLHGRCGYTAEMFEAMDGKPLSAAILIAIQRDGVGGWMMPAVNPDNPPYPEPVSVAPTEDSDVQYAHFSMDLRDVFELPAGPAKYWVMASFGDAVTERLLFEVVVESAEEGEKKKKKRWLW
jgi:hypothetical protein